MIKFAIEKLIGREIYFMSFKKDKSALGPAGTRADLGTPTIGVSLVSSGSRQLVSMSMNQIPNPH